MSIDETPIPPCGKRKRSQRLEIVDNGRSIRHSTKIKPLHQSIVDKIEKFCHPGIASDDVSNENICVIQSKLCFVHIHNFCCFLQPNSMETQSIDDNCDVASESSISWSGGEGHEGDDELTDWAPSMDNPSIIDQSPWNDTDPREIRAGNTEKFAFFC